MGQPSEPTIVDSVADATPLNWVDRYASKGARPYLRLARADRPIGTWLLLWPCLWSLFLALPSVTTTWSEVIRLIALFGVGSFVMRGAGCTYNDIVDRDIDAAVERTRSRPLPSGQVSTSQAWIFLFAQCAIGLLVLLSLSQFAIWLGLASLGLIAVYPFMKRVTYWPQIWLGLTFNWGALMGYAALADGLSLAPILLYVGAIFWTIGYDTIYAHQDKEDDLLAGVKSSALKLGNRTPFWLGQFYGAAWGLMLMAGIAGGLGLGYFVSLMLGGGHLLRQMKNLDIKDTANCLRIFKSNRDFGAIIAIAILMGFAF